MKRYKIRWEAKLLLLGSLAFLLTLVRFAGPAHAQEPWPPFWFNLTPSYQDGTIRYHLAVYSRVDRQMPDLTVKIPLPEGTRFVEAYPEPGVEASFDGKEVTFFTSAFDRYLENSAFVIEQIDSSQTIFTTQPWVSWKGSLSGNYLSDPVLLDLSRAPLNWVNPASSRLQLGVGATVTGERLTYHIYPRAEDQYRMFDLQIRVSLPPGAELLQVSAPPSFVTDANGQEILFSTLELVRGTEIGPLTVALSTSAVADAPLVTQIVGRWTNGPRAPIPGTPPNPVRNNGNYVAGPAPPTEETVTIEAVITQPRQPQQLVFDQAGDAPLAAYDLTSLSFREGNGYTTVSFTTAGALGPVGEPLRFTFLLDRDCSLGTGRTRLNRGAEFRLSYDHQTGQASMVPWSTSLADWDWSQFAFIDGLAVENMVMLALPHDLVGAELEFCWQSWAANDTDQYYPDPPPDWLPNAAFDQLTRYEIPRSAGPGLAGNLAVPIQNGRSSFDTYIFSIPTGREIARIADAHQPAFQPDGQRLVVKGVKSQAENLLEHTYPDGRTAAFVLKNFDVRDSVFEYNLVDQTVSPVGTGGENRLPFDNFDDRYPVQLADQETDIPADVKGELATFTTFRDGDWEAYAINSDGTGLRNLSASPDSRDGLPTISPDGDRVAFVSDRGGQWGVWIVPSSGGIAQKLFDLPALPFGEDSSDWTSERMSWGP